MRCCTSSCVSARRCSSAWCSWLPAARYLSAVVTAASSSLTLELVAACADVRTSISAECVASCSQILSCKMG